MGGSVEQGHPPILTARAVNINHSHDLAQRAARSMLTYAIAAGEQLLTAKKAVPHGSFGDWCRENLTFSYDTAAQYMRAARIASKSVDLHNFDGGIRAFLDAHADRPKNNDTLRTMDKDEARKVLGMVRMAETAEYNPAEAAVASEMLARMANSANENEASVAQEMIDRLGKKFGLTGEEAEVAQTSCARDASRGPISRHPWRTGTFFARRLEPPDGTATPLKDS